MPQKKEKILVYIHGGEPFNSYKEYLEDLKKYKYNPFKEKKRWSETLDLIKNIYKIIKIPMPCKQNAKYEEWKIMFEKIFYYLNKNQEVTLLGWSLGGIFLIKYFCENKIHQNLNIKKLHLLGTPFDNCGDFDVSEKILQKISINPEILNFYHSKDDFVVPFEDFLKYKKFLPKAYFTEFKDRNHFLQEELPELLEKLKQNS